MAARGPIGLVGGHSTGGNFFKCGKSLGGFPACAIATARPTREPIPGRDLRLTFIEQRDLRQLMIPLTALLA
jgi:hypothetical protein